MFKKYVIVVITALFISHLQQIKAQDFHLSQYDAPSLFLNPALTGLINGYYRIHAHYRNQWSSVTTPFTTTALSYDMPFRERIGIGGLIINDRAGLGNYNVMKITPSGSYDYNYRHHHIAGGLQIGIIHKSVNMDKLMFRNQYTNTNTGGFDPGLPTGEILENTSIIMPEINAGILYYFSNDQFIVNPFLGFTVFHITEPNESFFGNTNKLPRRFVLHPGVKVNITPEIQITPQMLYMNTLNVNETAISFIANYYFRSQDAWIFGGPTYRVFTLNKKEHDAMIILLGINWGKFIYRFSYDINTSALSNISGGKGGFELSVTYISKKIAKPKIMCPRL